MKLMFKQRLFSWLDSYDVFDRDGSAVYTVKGELSWGHRLQIYDAQGEHLGTVQEKVLTLLPRFQLYLGDRLAGTITKEFTFFRPRFTLDCNGWTVDGDLWEWDYQVMDGSRTVIIENGRFVLAGVEKLNEPLQEDTPSQGLQK